nr:hypothetical protein [Tanacetum cinerariifolium]
GEVLAGQLEGLDNPIPARGAAAAQRVDIAAAIRPRGSGGWLVRGLIHYVDKVDALALKVGSHRLKPRVDGRQLLGVGQVTVSEPGRLLRAPDEGVEAKWPAARHCLGIGRIGFGPVKGAAGAFHGAPFAAVFGVLGLAGSNGQASGRGQGDRSGRWRALRARIEVGYRKVESRLPKHELIEVQAIFPRPNLHGLG